MKRPGKPLPHLVLRPFVITWQHMSDDNHLVFGNVGKPFFAICIILSVFFIIGGVATYSIWTATEEIIYIKWGIFCLVIGGGGFVLGVNKIGLPTRFTVFDRQKGRIRFAGYIRKGLKFEKQKIDVPFSECEGRVARRDNPQYASFLTALSIHHDSTDLLPYWGEYAERDDAIGAWSFFVQFMDKDAPLPDHPALAGYPNRTKGVGTGQEWEKAKKQKGFIDPMDVWEGRVGFSPPEGKDEFLSNFEPKNQSIDTAKTGNDHSVNVFPPEADAWTDIALPKKLLRPFMIYAHTRCDAQKTIFKRRLPIEKYYYIACWTIFCAGLALFSVQTSAAILMILAAIVIGSGLWLVRRNRGIVLDRKNQSIVFHHGPFYSKITLPFNECEGRMLKTPRKEGFNTHSLFISHPTKGRYDLAEGWSWNLNHLLGLWSYIVQYLDKNVPLPDIKELKDHPDREPGLGSCDEFAQKSGESGFVDPYIEWLKELAKQG